jgi:hypothetical protein
MGGMLIESFNSMHNGITFQFYQCIYFLPKNWLSDEEIILSYHDVVSSMFEFLLLLAHDCNLEFGMSELFKDAILNLLKISPE